MRPADRFTVRFFHPKGNTAFPSRGVVFPFFLPKENTVSFRTQDRVVCLLLGGTGRPVRKTSKLAAFIRPLIDHIADVIAALA